MPFSAEVGDICLFDNHKIQHYAVSDYHPHPRRILRMSFAPQKIIAG
jgi:alpha-ketoglutarate-dependent taurine dioxygenase